MKIYRLLSSVNGKGEFAVLRPSNTQNIKEVDVLDVWWDDWCSGGDKIGDFVSCGAINVCKSNIFKILIENFKELKNVELRYNKTEKELNAKNIKRLKWLPKEAIPLTAFFSPISFDCLPQSTIVINERGMIKFIGVAELRGDVIIPREQGKGLFFSSDVIGDFDFFTLTNSGFLLCTERVKEFCENNNFENVAFLEMGEII
ncbi:MULTISPECIES: imm11 family protein [Bacteroidaceae]|uniref:imm11 family protein n=1 Tax=Bacteroidaceae TaxID=815 RepID=UPI003569E9FE